MRKPKVKRVAIRCYAHHPETGAAIMIMRGTVGYFSVVLAEGSTVDGLNAALEVTPAEREAMLAGSIFGWDCPGADPANYDENGRAIRPRSRS